ncbi:hypothetical protein [Serinibacter salmoneus]|uniref:hypothetical protein n=1 Tax=Serinibacter salmoneus TaxID=556530 RepID=UPI00117A3B9E|nr:hypothetical protein [Serinibacter salmoneus]
MAQTLRPARALAGITLSTALLAACSTTAGGDVGSDLEAAPSDTPTAAAQTEAAQTDATGAETTSAATTPEPTPTTPDPQAIRQVDPATLEWIWWQDFAAQEPVDVTAADEFGRTYTIGDPAYSDADGDGLEDMVVSLAQLDGNGYREQWFLWLAEAEGAPTQVLPPVTGMARCGDAVESVEPTEGGFLVREFLREPIIDDHLDCAATGTYEVTRRVGAVRDGDTTLLVDLADPRGYGGLCPTHPRTEIAPVTVWGGLTPRIDAALTIDGEERFLIPTHGHTMTAGAEPMLLASTWAVGESFGDRICVWIDPVRYEG